MTGIQLDILRWCKSHNQCGTVFELKRECLEMTPFIDGTIQAMEREHLLSVTPLGDICLTLKGSRELRRRDYI